MSVWKDIGTILSTQWICREEFHVVLFMEGTLAKPKTRLGRQVGFRSLGNFGGSRKVHISCIGRARSPRRSPMHSLQVIKELDGRDMAFKACHTAIGLLLEMSFNGVSHGKVISVKGLFRSTPQTFLDLQGLIQRVRKAAAGWFSESRVFLLDAVRRLIAATRRRTQASET